jgi:hypothetical protein
MREICLDEGMTQGYLDGELSLEMMEHVAGHIAACVACAEMVREAEGEWAMFQTAFADELAQPVPSEQLRVRINSAIDALDAPATTPQAFQQKDNSGLRAWLGAFAATFTQQRAAGFASLVALVAFAAIFFAVYRHNPGPATANEENSYVASNESSGEIEKTGAPVVSEQGPSPASTGATQTQDKPIRRNNKANTGAQFLAANYKPQRATALKNNSSTGTATTLPVKPVEAELPGEKSYLKTIASLTTAIDSNNTLTMQPTLRAEYERNLALVNQAISSTRPLALSKPGDPAATQFLYSAYQSKIELLSAVADRQSEAIARR